MPATSPTRTRQSGRRFLQAGQADWSVLIFVLASSLPAAAADPAPIHFRCEKSDSLIDARSVSQSDLNPGRLLSPVKAANEHSWRFDGRSSIVYGPAGNSDGFAENFTWEGFFLSPKSNSYSTETGIADRLVSQFAFDKGNWTRLAIGLVAGRKGTPRLSVELEGFDGRTFGLGDRTVEPDRWHHFALVHEGTASAAKIRWFLDYRQTGELFLGGQANQNTLRPPGRALFTIGARLRDGQVVNRGFDGFIDEVRLSPAPLRIEGFLRCDDGVFQKVVDTSGQRRDENVWRKRHAKAGELASQWAPQPADRVSIGGTLLEGREVRLVGDAAFLRRLSLAIRGRIPTLDEVSRFLAEDRPDKRSRIIDQFLASPEWADSQVGYWQDVLAENPSVVFPTLNNSGPFRQWLYESFRDNKPFDQFATELLLLENPAGRDDGPAGFALATGNDAPMAMRASVALKAFAAVDLKCARCHDSPLDRFAQKDLFLLASYLNGGLLTVPATSVAAAGKATEPGLITTSLVSGQRIEPTGLSAHWLGDLKTDSLSPLTSGSRAELAALLTSPGNSRFSDVIVNRMWKRLFGEGLVEPVDQWVDSPEPTHPELLRSLSAEFVESGYDLKQLSRRILCSAAWQRPREGQLMSAEQLVDSLFVAVGKDFQAETMGVHATDPGAVQLPKPRRAWQFAALPNERDRPSLGMPVNQTIVDVMTVFGWNGSRQQPRTEREQTTSALQPLLLFNGLISQRIVRLSEQSAITDLCLRKQSVEKLTEQLFLSVLTRKPNRAERDGVVAILSPAFEERLTGKPARPFEPLSTFQPDWRKHLEPEQTRLMLAAQERVAKGEPPTLRLTDDFRERAEDVLWALINIPEFVVVP